jgi:rhomboid protease GluP
MGVRMQPEKNRLQIVTIGFVIINILVFLFMEINGNTEDTEYMIQMGAVWPPYVEQGQYWRLLTATFMHFGFEHILNNMLILVCAGTILEKALGHVKYALLYLFAGVGGSTLSYLQMLGSGHYAVAAGASGAIFGIIGALLWIVICHRGRYESLTGKGLLFMIAISLYYGISSGEVDNWGHVGGLVMGFLLCVILYRKRRKAVDFTDENPYTYN